MAFNTKEQEIIKYGLANGKTKEQVQQALTNFRLGIQPQKENTNQLGYLENLKNNLTNTGQDITNSVGKVLAGPQNKPGQTLGQKEMAGINYFAKDVPEAALRTVGGIASTVMSPVTELPVVKNTIQGIGSLISKIPGVSDIVKNASSLAQQHPEIAKDIQNIVDIATLGGVGMAEKPVKEAVVSAGEKIAEPLVGGIEKTGTLLKGAGEKSYGITITPQEQTMRALVAYDAKQPNLMGRIKNFITGEESIGTKPITESNTAARKGIVGTEYQIGVQSKKIGDELYKGIIQPKLQQVKNAVDMKTFISDLEKEVKKTPELGRRNDLTEALNAFKEDYKNVGVVSGEKLQQYKEGWAKFIPEKSYKGKPIGSAFKEIQDMAAGKARDIIYKIVGEDGKQAYFDYGNLKSITESGIKSKTGDLAKKSLSRDIWQTVMDQAITPVATFSGKVLYKTGEGLEFIGQKGAKKIKDIIK